MHQTPEVSLRSLVELLQIRASEADNATEYAFLDEDRRWDTRQLEERARSIAAALQSTGKPGDRVLLVYPPSLEYLAAFFGCLFAGQIAVPAYPPIPEGLSRTTDRIRRIAEEAGITTVCTTSALLANGHNLLAGICEGAAWLATDEITTSMAAIWKDPGPQPTDIAFLQYTSGSTSSPKGVMISHGNLLHQLHSLCATASVNREDRMVSWLPPYHDMGLIGGLLAPVYTRMSLLLMSPLTFLKHPVRWLEAITSHRATVSVAPNFAYELCTRKVSDAERAGLDLSTWSLMMSGAEPVRMDTMRRFVDRFGPCGVRWDAFYPCYGLAEGTLMASGGSRTQAPESVVVDGDAYGQGRVELTDTDHATALEFAACGASLPDQDVLIIDPQSRQRLPEGRVGEIWLQGPSIAQGYWGADSATADAFQANVAREIDSGPYLRTGDLGFWLNGQLHVSGRLKDLIVLNGFKYHPEDIESSLFGCHPALRPGSAVTFAIGTDKEEVVAVLETKALDPDSNPEIVDAIRRAVRRNHGIELDIVLLVAPRTISKTSSGKVQRNLCRTAFLSDEIEGYRWLRAATRQRPEELPAAGVRG